MNFRSHSRAEVAAALAEGKEAWMLDTGSQGDDDVLIGDKGEVTRDLLDYFDVPSLPEGWSLVHMDAEWL